MPVLIFWLTLHYFSQPVKCYNQPCCQFACRSFSILLLLKRNLKNSWGTNIKLEFLLFATHTFPSLFEKDNHCKNFSSFPIWFMGLVLQHQHDRSPAPHIQSLCWQLQYVTEASQRGITVAPFLCNLLSFGDPISDVLMQQIDSHTVTIYHLSLETVVTLFFFFFYLSAWKKISFEKCFSPVEELES